MRRYIRSSTAEVITLLLATLMLTPCAAGDATPATSELRRLAISVDQAPEMVRRDFAETVLAEMVTVHTAEADRAFSEARHKARDRDLASWARATAAYAGELQALADSLAGASALKIGVGIGPEDVAYLDIDGRLVMVTSPRMRQQSVFERHVIERFCDLHHCDDYLASYQPPQAVLQPVAIRPRWSFSQQAGPMCSTDDGLVFQFQDMTGLDRKRRACNRVVAELNALATLLTREAAHGTRIDWNRLAIRSVSGEDRQLVTLNGDGDSAPLTLPALASATTMFRQLRPWLAARVDGNSYRLVLLNSGQLMATVMQDQD